MQIPTFAIIIGISEYQSQALQDLPGARADALHFARSLVNWGIPESHLILMCNPQEQKETLAFHLQQLALHKDPFQLVFFFCGHGHRVTLNEQKKSYLLFSDSHIEKEGCINAWEPEELVHSLIQLNTTNIYLFIDACHLRINSISHPGLKKEMKAENDFKQALFCLLSSGIFSAYENPIHNYGYFSEALVKALAKIRKSDRSPSSLIHQIREELQIQDLHDLESYNIDLHRIDFLPPLTTYIKHSLLIRQEVIADLQDFIVLNRHKAICITGPEGCGKTTLAQQLSCNLLDCYLVSLITTLNHLHDQLVHGILNAKIIQVQSSSPTIEECLDYLQQQRPHAVLIIDEITEKNLDRLKETLELFSKRSLKLLFLSSNSYQGHADEQLRDYLIEYSLPPFSFEETALLALKSGFSDQDLIELYHLISKGNPQKLNQILKNPDDVLLDPQEKEDLIRAIQAIYSCGFFIDQRLFSETFGLESATLNFLEKNSLLFYQDGCWVPHPFLLKIAESEQFTNDPAAKLAYWLKQFEESPKDFITASQVIFSIKSFGYEPKFDLKLLEAFRVLDISRTKGLDALKKAVEIFTTSSKLSQSSLYLAELLIERQEFDLAEKLLSLSSFSTLLDHQSRLSYAHLLWRTGLFTESIQATNSLLAKIMTFPEKMHCYLHRGAAHYFLGNWNEAYVDFSFVHKNSKDPRCIGLSRCLLGTITGIRGINVPTSQAFIESGIQILLKEEDLAKAWIGFNNLGEILWKAGNFGSATYYLQKASQIAEELLNTSLILETTRNLLQLEFRTPFPNLLKINKMVEKIEKLLENNHEFYELFQVYNTLCTVYFYLEDRVRSRYYLKKALPLTSRSKEYHIYTLANLSLHFKKSKWEEKSIFFLDRACQLAREGNNTFALNQIEMDYRICFDS